MPTTFGPLRRCMDAMTLRSAKVKNATANSNGTVIPKIFKIKLTIKKLMTAFLFYVFVLHQ